VRKIPTLLVRDPDDRAHVTDQVTPGCEWVLAGEGVATRKFDGTCVMLDADGRWWARREVRPGKPPPPNFIPVEHDPETGKTVGWEPIQQSGWAKWHQEALDEFHRPFDEPGTFELCGPRINGNPEGWGFHDLIRHGSIPVTMPPRLTVAQVCDVVRSYRVNGRPIEGVVWHHPDGRRAKLKARDLRP